MSKITDGRTRVIEAERAMQASSMHANATAAQRQRILARLHTGPATTIEIRRDLDVLAVGVRIHELRRAGHNIVTLRVHEPTACGRLHCVAKYVLQRGKSLL